jgi:hypothetical protein
MFDETGMMQLQDVAETICEHALERAYAPCTRSKRRGRLQRLLEDWAFVQRFRVGLAQGVANVLAAYDERVLSVYLFGDTDRARAENSGSARPELTVQLLVLVSARSAALDALAAALGQALAREVRKLAGPVMDEQQPLLNLTVITEDEVAQRKGVALLFSAAFNPPLAIWTRDGDES